MWQQIKKIMIIVDFRRRYIVFLLSIHFFSTILSIIIPKLTSLFIDYAIPEKSFSILIYIALGQLIAIAISCITQGINMYYGEKISLRLIKDGQLNIFIKILKMPLLQFSKYSIADLLHVMNNDIIRYVNFMKTTIIGFIVNIITLSAVLLMIFLSNWVVGIISIIFIPFFALSFQINNKKLIEINKEITNDNVLLGTKIHDIVANKMYVESCAKEEYEINKISNDFKDLYNKNLYQNKLSIIPVITSMIISSMIILLVYFIGSIYAIKGFLSAGSIVAITSWITMIGEPVNSTAITVLNYKTIMRSIERSNEIIDMALTEFKEKPFIGNIHKIESENIYFSYDNVKYVLKDLTFCFNQNESIAIIGENGSGKSTFTKLLLKLYEKDKGKIKINGIDINEYSPKSIREHIAYVPQNVVIWRDSILNNILYTNRNKEADHEYINKLIKIVDLEELLKEEVINKEIGENGFDLSGGQRQKLAILRALYTKPDVLVLDEATSNIDVKTETKIYEEIRKLLPNTIMIVITHRIPSITSFDKIILLKQGEIICSGKHENLLKNNYYMKLYTDAVKERKFAMEDGL